jgi:hypothetical protein
MISPVTASDLDTLTPSASVALSVALTARASSTTASTRDLLPANDRLCSAAPAGFVTRLRVKPQVSAMRPGTRRDMA